MEPGTKTIVNLLGSSEFTAFFMRDPGKYG
jgi:hypothetical protein